jgi:Carboxypeptidase regulatory-like domain/TonB-dependent Receptor Plug Domain
MKFLYALIVSLICFTAIAQDNKTLIGIIKQPESKPGSKATVALMNLKDSSRKNTISDEQGAFKVLGVDDGSYIITITKNGFKKFQKTIQVGINSRDIELSLTVDPQILNEVGIKAKQNIVKISGDKKVYNVGQDITAVGGSAADVLKNVPSVSVDPVDGGVSIRGNQNITLLIDGRPSVIFGDDVATALMTIPAASIETIEVITNAGAAYDAQGKGGVLNIVLKKDRKAGYNGNINANIGTPYRINIGLSLNANKKKWNVFLNSNARTSYGYTKEITTRTSVNDTTTYTTNRNIRKPKSGFVLIGAEYNFDKQNKLTVSQNFFGANMFGDINTNLTSAINFGPQLNRTYRTNLYEGHPRNTTTSINYLHTFKRI